MGRQLTLYFLPEDLAELEQVLRERDAAFIAYYHHSPELTLCETLDPTGSREPFLWATRREDLDQVVLKYVEQQGYWLVDMSISPVLEVSRGGPFDGTRVPKGRLYFRTEYLDRDKYEMVPFPPEFVDWAQKILMWVRRHYRRDKKTGHYWSPRAQAWQEATTG